MARGAVRRTIAAPVIRLVVSAHWIIRADGRALESAAKDAGKAWRRPDKAAKGALRPRCCSINQNSTPVGSAARRT
jgi:hypothetical protein